MKNIVLSSFLLVGLISEFSLGGIFEEGISAKIQEAILYVIVHMPHVPKLDHGKIALIYPNFMGETLEETEQHLPKYVSFYLYTRKNPKVPQKLILNETDSLKNSYFDPRKPTRIFVHGWLQSSDTFPSKLIRDALIQHADYNVIMMDWHIIALNIYAYADHCVLMLAKYLSYWIDFLVDQGVQASKMHLIGHSLGAHIIGLGSRFSKKKVSYAVGVDPAYPAFENVGPGKRLSTEDADYVQVIHGSGGHLGFPTPLGHSDFYANGGSEQPVCKIDIFWACSHFYTLYYYGASINDKKGFWARKCDNYENFKSGKCHSNPAAVMGTDEPHTNVTGVYFFDTSEYYPYALGLEDLSNK